MVRHPFALGCAILSAVVAGCYTGGDIVPPDRSPLPVGAVDGTDPTAAAITGVPCDVAQVLARDCAGCHSTTPTGGAPNSMMNYDDLLAPSLADPGQSVAAISISRMKDGVNPMPPDGAPAEDLAAIESWIAGGMPRGAEVCNATAAQSIYDTPSVCTSNTKWTRANRGSSLMRPGGACIKCHDDMSQGPIYDAAGTVYATAHEPDDCNGSSQNVQVVITDAANKTYTATVNAAGNFFFANRTAFKLPYKAKVVSGSKSRAMSEPQTDGDCNKCHTENGTTVKGSKQENAPGRVMAP